MSASVSGAVPAGPLLFTDILFRHAAHIPDRLAVVDEGGSLTYGELWEAVEACANGLAEAGVGHGDRVAIAMGNSLAYLVLILGCFRRGAVSCNLNIRLTTAEFGRFLAPIQPAVIVCDPAHRERVAELGIPVIEMAAAHDQAAIRERMAPLWSEARAAFQVEERDLAIIIPTGGTTGVPKGAMIPHRSIYLWVNSLAGLGIYGPSDYAFATSPFFHAGVVSRAIGPLSVGARVRVGTFSAERMLHAIQDGATLLAGAVTFFDRVREHPDFATTDRSKVRHIAFGAMAAPPVFFESLSRDFPNAELSHSYGATEVGGVTHMPGAEIAQGRTDGVGRVAPGAIIEVVDDDMNPVPTGELGELILDCPWRAVGYYGCPEETAATFTSRGVRIGDLGRFDPDGWLHISGRKKEMIISGGENVFPLEVEAVLCRHPAVNKITVYGARDERWGERVEAAVVLQPDASLTLDELVTYGRAQLGGYKLPKSLKILEEIPLTAIGKPDRRRLSAEAEASA